MRIMKFLPQRVVTELNETVHVCLISAASNTEVNTKQVIPVISVVYYDLESNFIAFQGV